MTLAPSPIDLSFLSRQTDGDVGLQREVLTLFVSQASSMRTLLLTGACNPELTAGLHRLKGAARAVGAHRVAALAQALEDLAEASAAGSAERRAGADRLVEAITEACRYAANLPS